MTDCYLDNEAYFRLIDFLLDSPLGTILGEGCRDNLMIALGERAGIWPESSRSENA